MEEVKRTFLMGVVFFVVVEFRFHDEIFNASGGPLAKEKLESNEGRQV